MSLDLVLTCLPQGSQHATLDSPIISYEDHIATQILNQFPEIGQILDRQNQ